MFIFYVLSAECVCVCVCVCVCLCMYIFLQKQHQPGRQPETKRPTVFNPTANLTRGIGFCFFIFLESNCQPHARHRHAQKKIRYIVALYSQYSRTLTCRSFCQARTRIRSGSGRSCSSRLIICLGWARPLLSSSPRAATSTTRPGPGMPPPCHFEGVEGGGHSRGFGPEGWQTLIPPFGRQARF